MKGMSKQDLRDIINEKLGEMDQAINSYKEVEPKVEEINQTHITINKEGGVNQQIEEIEDAHSKIVLGDNEQPAFRSHIEALVKKFNKVYKKIKQAESSVSGYTTTNDSDEEVYMPGTQEKLEALYKQQKEQHEEINQASNSILGYTITNDSGEEVHVPGIKEKLDDFYTQQKEQHEEINQAGKSILGYTTTNDSGEEVHVPGMKGKLDDFYTQQKEQHEEINQAGKSILGYTTTDDSGEEVHVPGMKEKLDNFYKEQEKIYKKFYDEIERVLGGGSTSVELARTFARKADEYKKTKWSIYFIRYLAAMIIISAIIILLSFLLIDEPNLSNTLLYSLPSLPILGFSTWLGIFLSNRRAENKKLEEIYTHKEAMARSYEGYRRAIKNLDEENKELLQNYMASLIEAIAKDPSIFLTSKGDKHLAETILEEISNHSKTLLEKMSKHSEALLEKVPKNSSKKDTGAKSSVDNTSKS